MLAVARFSSLRPGLRAAVAFTFGALALPNGGRHLQHMLHDGTTANDVTGVLALAAGVVLVGLAAWIPFRHRGKGAATPARRWAVRVVTVPAVVLAVYCVFMPVGIGIVDIHSLHRPIGNPPSADVRDGPLHGVGRRRPRGLVPPVAQRRLAAHALGRRRQPPQRAAPRRDAHPPRLRRARLRPARQRQQRGHHQLLRLGLGEGRRGGARLPRRRDDRVGVLGLSTGADIAIDIAARRDDVQAVVADGAAAIGYKDIEEYMDSAIERAPMWLLFKTIEVIQGRSGPEASLADQIARSRAPHLIIAAGVQEKKWGELYDRAGGDHSELWYLPDAGHTAALRQYPEAYEQRVSSFFDEHLLG